MSDTTLTLTRATRPHAGLRIIGLIAVIWLGLLARDGFALKLDWDALQSDLAALSEPNAKLDLAALAGHVASTHSNLQALRAHLAPLMIAAPLLGWIPKIGGDIQAAPALLNMATEMAGAGDEVLSAIAPGWPLKASGDQSAMEQIAHNLGTHQSDLIAAKISIDHAGTFRPQINRDQLSDQVQALLDKFDEFYPSLQSGAGLLAIAPQLLGLDRPRTYLALIQNEDELRPTGGFISAAARVTLSAGQIISLTVIDGYLVDDYRHKPYGNPPDPLYTVMGTELWLFRDANWSPDFPTAANKAADLYQYGQGGGPFDGVIAIDQRVVETLVAAIEPLEVKTGTPPVTSENIIEYMRAAWGPAANTSAGSRWLLTRKDFIARLSQTILDRVLHSPDAVRWPTLARGLLDRLNEHDILITLNYPYLNALMSPANWSGAFQKSSGDYLMVVDANLGFNKANAAVTETVQYAVTIQSDRSLQTDLKLTYSNLGAAEPGCLPGSPDYDLSITYEALIDLCYWDYLRVLTPPGAHLTAHTPFAIPASYILSDLATDGSISVTRELDKNSFGSLLVVERGTSVRMNLRYTLPATLITREGDHWLYRLVWQKEPGAGAWPIEFTLNWPINWRLLSAAPAPQSIDAQSIKIVRNLDRDFEIEVRFSEQR